MKLQHNAIRGITVWQPMAYCIEIGMKPLENRTFRPWAGVTHLAIHAGLKWHEPHAQQIRESLMIDVPPKGDLRIHHGAIVAIARIGTIYTEDDEIDLEALYWFSGPFGWRLEDVVALDPVACTGAQGLWQVPKLAFTLIQDQLAAKRP